MPSVPPKVVSAAVVAAQPTDADSPMIGRLSAELNRRLPPTAFIVKIQLEQIPEPTGDGWALYVGDTRIPKYWEYPGGIYFKVFDQTFLVDHHGEPLRFSHNDKDFVNTGVKLPGPGAARASAKLDTRNLPLQSDVLNDARSRRPVRARKRRPARKRAVRATATRRQVRRRKPRRSK
jgi:hypothetical protein